MKKITEFLIKNKYFVILFFAVLLALSIVGTVFLVKTDGKINSDMMTYLTDDFDTQKGLAFLKDNFGVRGDGMFVVRGTEDDADLRAAIAEIKKMDGVNLVIWEEDADEMERIKDKLADFDLSAFEGLNNEELREALGNNELFADFIKYFDLAGFFDAEVDVSELKSYLKKDIGGGYYDYVIIMMTDYAPSTNDAYALFDNIKAKFASREYASSGMTETAQVLMEETLGDLPNFIIFAVLAAVIILVLATSSFVDPIIVLTTLGISIMISMGINYLYPSVSIISFATSAVLQLAITMDYSIFFMHIYKKNRKDMSAYASAVTTVPEAASSILASGLTTIGGFVALYFMRFRVGADIAGVIIKGVVMSLLTILVLQPIITLLMDKAITKTTHDLLGKINEKIRVKKPDFKGISKENIVRPIASFLVGNWQRIVLAVIAVGLLVPAFLGQSKLQYSYFKMYEEKNDTPEKVIAAELGNQMIIAVPLYTITGTQYDFIDEIKADPSHKVSGITGAFTAVKNLDPAAVIAAMEILASENGLDETQTMINGMPDTLSNDLVHQFLTSHGVSEEVYDSLLAVDWAGIDLKAEMNGVDLSMLKSFFAKVKVGENEEKWYTLYTVNISGGTEDAEAMATYEYMTNVMNKYFGKEYYSIGMLTGSHDMAKVTPTDFLTVTLVSAGIIFVIIAILLRNPLKSLLLVVLIELGIWINLSFTFLLGENINFMVYIIISSVQLGCTVDYAILLANTFEKKRSQYSSGKECAIAAASEAVPALFVSALLIISVCMSVYFVSGNLVIKQLTGMLARGAGISFVLVTIVQTAVMSFFKTERKKKNYEEKLKSVEEKLGE